MQQKASMQHYADYKAYGRDLMDRVLKYANEDIAYLDSASHKQSQSRPYRVVRKGDVCVYERRMQNCPINMLRATVVVNTSALTVMEWMCEPDFLHQLDPGCVGAKRQLKKFDDEYELTYYVYGGTGPVSKRDFVTFECNVKEREDLYVTAACSVESSAMPPQKDLVRGVIWTSGYVLQDLPDGRCNITYIMHGSPEGYIPSALVNLAQSRQPYVSMARIKARYSKAKPRAIRKSNSSSATTPTQTTPTITPSPSSEDFYKEAIDEKGDMFTKLFEELMKHPIMMERIMNLDSIKRLLHDSATFTRVLDSFKEMKSDKDNAAQIEMFDDPQQLRDMLDLIITEKLPLEELNDFLKELFGLEDGNVGGGKGGLGRSWNEFEKKQTVKAILIDQQELIEINEEEQGEESDEELADNAAQNGNTVYFKVVESHILYTGKSARNNISSTTQSPKLSFSDLKASLTNGNGNGNLTHSNGNGHAHSKSIAPIKKRPARAFAATPQQINILNNLTITNASSVQQWSCSLHRNSAQRDSNTTWALEIAQQLKQTWRQLVKDYPALRVLLLKDTQPENSTTPVTRQPTWWQVLPASQAKLGWKQADWSPMAAADRDEAWNSLIRDDVVRDFDSIKVSSLMRFHVINYASDEVRFLWSFHSALLSPGTAYKLIKHTFAEAFNSDAAPQVLKEISISTMHNTLKSSKAKSDQIEHWKKTLADFQAPTPLFKCNPLRHIDLKRKRGVNSIKEIPVPLAPETLATLQVLAKKDDIPVFTTLLSAWSFMLSRCSGGEKRVLFGLSHLSNNSQTGRPAPTIPVLIDLNDDTEGETKKILKLWPFLRKTAGQLAELEGFAASPDCCTLEEIQKHSEVPSDYRLFNSLFVFDEVTHAQKSLSTETSTATVRVVAADKQIPSSWNYPLVLTCTTTATSFEFSLAYDNLLFTDASAQRVAKYYQTLLEGIASADQEQIVHYLPMLPRSEQDDLIARINSNWAEYPREKRVDAIFVEQVKRVPDRVAIEFEDNLMTYAELDRHVNQMAHWLVQHGIHGKDCMVALYMTRDFALPISMLAVMKAGAAYVPLDPRTPKDRVHVIFNDANVKCVITDFEKAEYLFADQPAEGRPVILCVDKPEVKEELAQLPSTPLPETLTSAQTSEDTIYVIYTSGSTGKPKGVRICHRGLINQFYYIAKLPGMSEKDVILGVSTVSFDIAQLELVQPLTMGARILMISAEVQRDGHLLCAVLEKNSSKSDAVDKLTIMQATPASWRMLCAAGWEGDPSILRLWCGGEAMTCDLAKQLMPRCKALYNMYGPTETTVWGSVIHVTPELLSEASTVPVGVGVDNSQFFILDAHRQLVPKGVMGELHIAGDGVGSYVDKGLTDLAYVDNPFKSWPGLAGRTSQKMFKVGDVLRCRDTEEVQGGDRRAEFDFLGRVDHQVKIRGYRIELEEIVNLLYTNTSVGECLVVAKQPTYQGGEKYLVAYVILKKQPAATCAIIEGEEKEKEKEMEEVQADTEKSEREKERERRQLAHNLRLMLEEKLPPYMVPSYFVVLDKWPLSPNGKIDRAALPLPTRTKHETFVAPRNDVEMKLIEAFEEVLQISPIGIEDDFFELGGNSLLGVSMVGAIEAKFGVQFPFSVIFSASNPRLLATCIENALASTTAEASNLSSPAPTSTNTQTNATSTLTPSSATTSTSEQPRQCATKEDMVTNMLAVKLINSLSSPAVALQANGSRPPLFFIHPAFKSSVCYGALSYYLGDDQPFYGLEPRVEYTTIEEMAAGYLEAIRTVRPKGPYWIGGWSFGCTVAYEIARQLQDKGEKCLLIMLDGRAPSYEDEGEIDLGAFVMCTLCRGAKQFLGFSVEVSYPEIKPMTPDERLMHVAEKVLQKDGLNNISPAVAGSFFFRFQKDIRDSEIMCRNYKPTSRYDGDIILFRSIHALPLIGFNDPLLDTRTLGWHEFIAPGRSVNVVDTDSDHESVVFQPAVQDVARQLRAQLGKHLS